MSTRLGRQLPSAVEAKMPGWGDDATHRVQQAHDRRGMPRSKIEPVVCAVAEGDL